MKSRGIIGILAQLLAILLAVVYLVPIYMTIMTSLKARQKSVL